jgi:cytochrome o ubiquinol oxidase subunit II
MRDRSLLVMLPALVGGCTPAVLDPAGPIGSQERLILFDSLAIMLAIVVPTILAILGFAFWYRAGNARARYLPDFAYSGRLELIIWSIPTLVILFLGGIAWTGAHDLDPAKPLPGKPLEVDVVAMDWKWLFIYPSQNVASIDHLVIPAGTPIHFRITSASVFNGFFIPRLGSQIYAMHGMVTQLNLQADALGQYQGLSSHFSGDGFSDMGFTVDAVSAAQFGQWTAQAQHDGAVLDQAGYHALLKQSQAAAVQTFRLDAPGLFDTIVNGAMPAGQGPVEGQVHVHPIGGK